MTNASAGAFGSGMFPPAARRGPRRAVEVLGVLVAFFWFWPLAAAYIAWKLMGYPGLGDLRASLDRGAEGIRTFGFGTPSFDGFGRGGFGMSGNAAFDAYRRSEIERLENERRRLDEEAREFRSFVDDLKKAKDREEFDAYMARRRRNGPTSV